MPDLEEGSAVSRRLVLKGAAGAGAAIPPSSSPNILGVLGGDLAGFPNGRRVFDDAVTIELRALAGRTYPLVDSAYTPDDAAGALTDGLTPSSLGMPFLDSFPYLGTPFDGYDDPSS